MSRLKLYEWAMDLARTTAKRSTCLDKNVGAVILNQEKIVIATGYNGAPRGINNCCEGGYMNCQVLLNQGDKYYCQAVHAEANALLAAGPNARGATLVCTDSPCRECTKLIINAGIRCVIYDNEWSKHRLGDWSPEKMLQEANILVMTLKEATR